MYSSHWIQGVSYKFKVVNFGHSMSGIHNICVFCYLTEIMKMGNQSLFETNSFVSFFFCSECCHFATSRGDKYKNFLLYFPIFIPVLQHYFVLKIMLRFFSDCDACYCFTLQQGLPLTVMWRISEREVFRNWEIPQNIL